MTVSLTPSELPRDPDGALVGKYSVRSSAGGVLEEVGDRPVGGFELGRLEAAYGASIVIAPADAETAEAVARHIFERTGDGARAKALRAMFASPRKRGKRDA